MPCWRSHARRLKRARRAWSRSPGCRCSSPGRPARRGRRRHAGRGLEGGVAVGGRRRVEVYAPQPCEEMLALAAEPPRGAIAIQRRAWQADDLRRRSHRRRRLRQRRRGGAFRRRRPRRGRPGQRHRQAGVLRLLVRRHRQPLAAGHRHLDRRRRAGVRPGDPRQARSVDPARLRAVGRGRAALAQRRQGVRPVVQRPAPVLADSSPRMRSRDPDSEPEDVRLRSRC